MYFNNSKRYTNSIYTIVTDPSEWCPINHILRNIFFSAKERNSSDDRIFILKGELLVEQCFLFCGGKSKIHCQKTSLLSFGPILIIAFISWSFQNKDPRHEGLMEYDSLRFTERSRVCLTFMTSASGHIGVYWLKKTLRWFLSDVCCYDPIQVVFFSPFLDGHDVLCDRRMIFQSWVFSRSHLTQMHMFIRAEMKCRYCFKELFSYSWWGKAAVNDLYLTAYSNSPNIQIEKSIHTFLWTLSVKHTSKSFCVEHRCFEFWRCNNTEL